MRNPRIPKDPWFIILLKKAGVTDRKTADTIVIVLAVAMLVITVFSLMNILDPSVTVDLSIEEKLMLEDPELQ